MTTPTMRGTSRTDLLALPSILLGFQPADSAVAVGFRGNTARFAARFDLGLQPGELAPIAAQVLAAAARVRGCGIALLAYGDLDRALDTIDALRPGLGDLLNRPVLVRDGQSTWSVDADGGATQFSEAASGLAAEAVFQGLPICHDRAAAVAPVERREPLPPEDEAFARARVSTLSDGDALDILGAYAESMAPLSDIDALFLALLLGQEDCVGAVFARLSTLTAEAMWPNLAAARRVAPADVEANVVGLLGVASWLSGRGAAQTSCLGQLERLAPDHFLLTLLLGLYEGAVPPHDWDQ